jgi:hypothetical protein
MRDILSVFSLKNSAIMIGGCIVTQGIFIYLMIG